LIFISKFQKGKYSVLFARRAWQFFVALRFQVWVGNLGILDNHIKQWRRRIKTVNHTQKLRQKEIEMITPTASFKDNLQLLPSVADVSRIDLTDPDGAVVASIKNEAGKQGSLVVYQYLAQNFGSLDAQAAAHGLVVFAEHTEDAKNRLGAHPNIDRLFAVIDGAGPLNIAVIKA
jgi:hypothetical protein